MSLFKESLKASMWSSLTEIVLKLINPIVFLILTRILSPEDFGVVAVATNLLSFIYIIADLGLSKVLIQYNGSEQECSNVYNVAFYTNILLGIVLFISIFLCSNIIAKLYNVPESSSVIRIMDFQILFFAISSVQNAIKKKELEFKFIFYVRLITVVVPAAISIPFAFSGYGYWAIVYGSTGGTFFAAIVTWIYTDWKPSLYWSKLIFRKLINKSIWSTLEQLFVWFPMFLDAYLISNYLSKRDLGMFSTSKTLFTTAMGVTLAAIIPVLFSTLSKIDINNNKLYNDTLLYVQKLLFGIVSVIGIGVFLFRSEIATIIFNKDWNGVDTVFGLMFLIMCFEYFFAVLTEGLRGRGYFREISVNTIIAISCTIVTLLASIQYGLTAYVIARSASLYYYFPGLLYWSNKKLSFKVKPQFLNNIWIFGVNIFFLIIIFLLSKIHLNSRTGIEVKIIIFLTFMSSLFYLERKTLLDLKTKIFGKNVHISNNKNSCI